MTRWWRSDGPADQAPPRMPAIQRVAEIFEALFNLEKDLTGELLADAGPLRCRRPREAVSRRHDRRRLSPTCPRWTRCPPTSPPADLCPPSPSMAPAWGRADAELSGAVPRVANPPEPKWDSNGYRISPKLPSSFPRITSPHAHAAVTGRGDGASSVELRCHSRCNSSW
jgi:hypothetical protein